ncbi:hypothetical protein GQ55_9G291600 [Panicum hallii var. hallii]|uniref:Uncharacterized protein n=1 Tax=Panicum hallii var. hallii TaxID=1504633 RepID=A0A2T7C7L5_9POAL|nr:hypothetical protein GQ55_9G291600 [Panicum hallii var. hallii]
MHDGAGLSPDPPTQSARNPREAAVPSASLPPPLLLCCRATRSSLRLQHGPPPHRRLPATPPSDFVGLMSTPAATQASRSSRICSKLKLEESSCFSCAFRCAQHSHRSPCHRSALARRVAAASSPCRSLNLSWLFHSSSPLPFPPCSPPRLPVVYPLHQTTAGGNHGDDSSVTF